MNNRKSPLLLKQGIAYDARFGELKVRHKGNAAFYKNGKWRVGRFVVDREEIVHQFNLPEDAVSIFEAVVDRAQAVLEQSHAQAHHIRSGATRQNKYWRKREAATKAQRSSYVYVLKDPSGRYKIGRAINVQKRAADLSLASGLELQIVHALKCQNTPEIERSLHDKFAAHRTKGEWFTIPHDHPELLKLLSA